MKRSAYRRARVNRCKAKIGSYPHWRPCKRLPVSRDRDLITGKFCWQHTRIVCRMIDKAWRNASGLRKKGGFQ